jgi:serine/threonine protein phosphatase PrpC
VHSAVPSLSISVGVQTSPGIVRPNNDDRIGSARTPLGDVFVLSDGKAGGGNAAKATVDGFIRHLQQQVQLPIEKALELAHSEFTSRLTSTVVIAVINGTRATVASCGDSRAYLLRGNRLGLITEDFSSRGRLSVIEVQLQDGDGLLLCSDGLWRQVPHADLEAIAISALTANAAGEAFLHLALHAGGKDNISLQWMRFAQPLLPRSVGRRWFGMRPVVAASLLAVAIALAGLAVWMIIFNLNRPM